MIEEDKVMTAYLENLYLLENQLLGLQIVSGQHNDFLNCSLVCGPQHTPVSYTPATSHPSACQQPLGFPLYILLATSNKG